VLPFHDTAEALSQLQAVTAEYERQCRDARDVAEAYFDSAKVLTDLLEKAVGTTPSALAQHCGGTP
jgi:F0F1-type ATP synthase membrane subunit b/b'